MVTGQRGAPPLSRPISQVLDNPGDAVTAPSYLFSRGQAIPWGTMLGKVCTLFPDWHLYLWTDSGGPG